MRSQSKYLIIMGLIVVSGAVLVPGRGMAGDRIEDWGLVEVEVDPLAKAPVTGEMSLIPYRERRARSSVLLEARRQSYLPTSLKVGTSSFVTTFVDTTLDAVELELTKKWNYRFLSVGLGVTVSSANLTQQTSKVQLDMALLGVQIYFDTIMEEPYLVPYFSIQGGYAAVTTAQADSPKQSILKTPMSYGVGLLLQLNWLSPSNSVVAYHEHHLENTYLAVGLRSLTASSDDGQEFKSEQQAFAGLTLEM